MPGCLRILIAATATVAAAATMQALPAKGAMDGFVQPPSSGAPFPSCPAVVLLGMRGSGEAPGTRDYGQGLGPPPLQVAKDLAAAVGNSFQYSYVPYPAVPVMPGWSLNPLKIGGSLLNGVGAKLRTYWLGAYRDSLLSGERQLRRMLLAEEQSCPQTKLAVVGYSQGAQASADVVAALTKQQRASVSVGLFGDPLYNHRSAADLNDLLDNNGILGVRGEFPADLRGRVLSVCHPTDPICQGAGQARHGDGAHKTYSYEPEPSAVAATVAPFPLAGVDCGTQTPPLADVSFRALRLPVSTSWPTGQSWARSTGVIRWRYFQLDADTACKEVTATGSFAVTVSARSPGGTGTVQPGVNGTFQERYALLIRGTVQTPAGRPTHGFLGTIDFGCQGQGCGFDHFPDGWLLAPGDRFVGDRAQDVRYRSRSGQLLWRTSTASFGDIRS
jgi:hypothetical protein